MNINPQKCPQNHVCPAIKVCPVETISQKGHGLPVIDESKCINCDACADFCPMKAIMK